MPKSTQNIQTENDIQTAFIKLVNERGFDKITIAAIADAAFINRQTFYYHYEDKYQLTESMIAEFIEEYDVTYQKFIKSNLDNQNINHRISSLFPDISEFLIANQNKTRALFSIEFNDYTLENELTKRFQKSLPTLLGREALPLENIIFPGITLNIMTYIANTGKIPTSEELITTFNSISTVYK